MLAAATPYTGADKAGERRSTEKAGDVPSMLGSAPEFCFPIKN